MSLHGLLESSRHSCGQEKTQGLSHVRKPKETQMAQQCSLTFRSSFVWLQRLLTADSRFHICSVKIWLLPSPCHAEIFVFSDSSPVLGMMECLQWRCIGVERRDISTTRQLVCRLHFHYFPSCCCWWKANMHHHKHEEVWETHHRLKLTKWTK